MIEMPKPKTMIPNTMIAMPANRLFFSFAFIGSDSGFGSQRI
jgi:hypothetical protein